MRKSKNDVTLEQLSLACQHAEQMLAAGVTENLAIRTLELFADVYAKLRSGRSATPHHVDQFDLWSVEARKVRLGSPSSRPGQDLRVEHGTPRRAFARMILDLHRRGDLNEDSVANLVDRFWKLAVITLDEDTKLNKVARSRAYATPEDRWAAAGIVFEQPGGEVPKQNVSEDAKDL